MKLSSLLGVEQLSTYLKKSVSSVRSDATRNPRSLPPLCRLPGTKRLLWREEDVVSWVAKFVVGNDATNAGATTPATENKIFDWSITPKRGRPTKAEQIARQRLTSSH